LSRITTCEREGGSVVAARYTGWNEARNKDKQDIQDEVSLFLPSRYGTPGEGQDVEPPIRR
jgi:hypothetical protein